MNADKDAFYEKAAKGLAASTTLYGVDSVIHVEDKDDIWFWQQFLPKYRSGRYKFLPATTNERGNRTTGCTQCLKYKNFLSQKFFICIDSDLRYLQEEGLLAENGVLQTYTYSWENHCAFASKLQQSFDEFQEFYYINQEIYSLMQDTWDRLRKQSHVNLIVSGSAYTLMNKIFRDSKEPLYGRADSIMKLAPFTTSVLKEILSDHKSNYTKDDLLALYTFTGGVPKYIEQFMDNGCTSMESMVDFMLQPDSSFLTEGQALLVQEFGKKYGNYFSILSAISNGKSTLPEMEAVMGGISLGGQLKRLEENYDLIKKKRPILSKESSQTVRYEVSDLFLRFWFRYFIKYQNYIEIQNFERLVDIIKKDYPTFSGLSLEMYFRQQMMESKEFADIGSWWQGKNNKDQDEIDIVGLYAEEKKALVAEVKRQSKNFKPDLFALKVEELRKKVLFKYEIESRLFSMEDM